MRTLQFLKKEMLHLIHAPQTVLLMLLFPALLTLVLGTAFSGLTARTIDLPEVKMPFVSDGGPVSALYLANSREPGIEFEETSREELDRRITAGTVKQYVEMRDRQIILHSDEQGSLEAMMVKMYSNAFIQQANLAATAMKEGRLDQISPQFAGYSRIESIAGKNEPNSFGYYGVTMLTMIIMYGTMQAMAQLILERARRTELRLIGSPYPMSRVFLVKTAAVCVMLLLQALVLILFNHFVYGIAYRSIWAVLLMLAPLAVFSTSMGVLVYQLVKNEGAASALLNILIVVIVFMGRGYMMVSPDEPFFAALSRFSPIGWINQGLFEYIYQDAAGQAIEAGVKLLAISVLMYALAFVLFKKEEGSDRVAAH